MYALARPLRWMAVHCGLKQIGALTPQVWYAYLDQRLSAGIDPKTVNSELSALKHFVHFLREHERDTCERFLLVEYLEEGCDLPKDIPLEQLRELLSAIRTLSHSPHAGLRRLGCMDLAWFLLMLFCGLRTGEVRHLKMSDIEWEARRLRIEQSKGLKDRLIHLNEAVLGALRAYLIRERLKAAGKRVSVQVYPHRLRHTCATQLLNAGCRITSIQRFLGHKSLNTTMIYAHAHDQTVAIDYFTAMERVEQGPDSVSETQEAPSQEPHQTELLGLIERLEQPELGIKERLEIAAQLRQMSWLETDHRSVYHKKRRARGDVG